jgi:hypothetical protein
MYFIVTKVAQSTSDNNSQANSESTSPASINREKIEEIKVITSFLVFRFSF